MVRLLLLLALLVLPCAVRANCVQGSTGTVVAGTCAKAANVLIGTTQAISNGASIQWTGLSGYDNYRMYCQGVWPATNNGTIFFQFGEGSTVWETSNYHWAALTNADNGTAASAFADNNDIGFNLTGSMLNTAGAGVNFVLDLQNFTSTVAYKTAAMVFPFVYVTGSPPVLLNGTQSASYFGDTNQITAVRLIADAGNVNGTCSLYGMIE